MSTWTRSALAALAAACALALVACGTPGGLAPAPSTPEAVPTTTATPTTTPSTMPTPTPTPTPAPTPAPEAPEPAAPLVIPSFPSLPQPRAEVQEIEVIGSPAESGTYDLYVVCGEGPLASWVGGEASIAEPWHASEQLPCSAGEPRMAVVFNVPAAESRVFAALEDDTEPPFVLRVPSGGTIPAEADAAAFRAEVGVVEKFEVRATHSPTGLVFVNGANISDDGGFGYGFPYDTLGIPDVQARWDYEGSAVLTPIE